LRSGEIIGGLVSSTTAIPLAMAFGMFAFVPLGDEYFAYGAMAGLLSAVIAGVISVVFGDRSTRVYAPRITTTFFLGLLLFSLLHRGITASTETTIASCICRPTGDTAIVS
jgi:MFS superfamily sulfate permease-like transporter